MVFLEAYSTMTHRPTPIWSISSLLFLDTASSFSSNVTRKVFSFSGNQEYPHILPFKKIRAGAFGPYAEAADKRVVFSLHGPEVVLELSFSLAPTILVLWGHFNAISPK